jgi:hypothetical protein
MAMNIILGSLQLKYPDHSKELSMLLEADQADKRKIGRLYFEGRLADNREDISQLKSAAQARMNQVATILEAIGEPRISYIGHAGVRAAAALTNHGNRQLIAATIAAFKRVEKAEPSDTDLSLIPALIDNLAVLERRPQTYGTMWLFDCNRWPFLYPVLDPGQLLVRRKQYSLGELRWPRSLAIPINQQPWLRHPIREHCMRWPTEREYQEFVAEHTLDARN